MSKQFVFLGAQGSYAVPPGESRIGSDAACQICIPGEGILPVHAYLRMDGEKLLIRPAAGQHAPGGSSGGGITVDGQPLAGPVILGRGQALAIGAVRLRVELKRRSLWSRRWLRRLSYAAAALVLLLLLAYLYLIFVLLDEGRLTANAAKAAADYLAREAEIKTAKINLFRGTLDLGNIKIRQRYNLSSSAAPLLSIDTLAIKMEPWHLIGYCVLGNWFHPRELTGVEVALTNPAAVVERAKSDGSFDIKDIFGKLRGGSLPELDQLSFELQVRGGSLRLHDDYTNIGETSFEDINLVLRQPPAGQPLEIKSCEMKTNAIPAPATPGRLSLTGHLNMLDKDCIFDARKLSSNDLKLAMRDFDLARLFEHFGYAWEPYGANFKVVLGKPITGEVNLTLPNPKNLRLHGSLHSASLLSIREEGSQPLGNIPMNLNYNVFLVDSGNGYRPYKLDVSLRVTPPSNAANGNDYLLCTALGQLNPGGASEYSFELRHCNLESLVGTDIGQRLGLNGRLGGRLEGNAKMTLDAAGRLAMDAYLKSIDCYVMVYDPAETAKPIAQRRPPVKQPLPLEFDCHATAEPNRPGQFSNVNIQSFNLSAPSVKAKSTRLGVLSGLGAGEKLEAHAQFQLNLKGREFWAEFAPILDLLGFTQPVQERLDLKVTVDGKDDLVTLAAEGTAERQWGAGPAPVHLVTVLDYNGKAARQPASEAPTHTLQLRVWSASAKDKPLDVRFKARCIHNEKEKADSIILEGYNLEGEDHSPPLFIKSDAATLRERFQPYLEGYLRRLDAAQAALGARASSPPEGGQDARAPSTNAAKLAALPGAPAWLDFYRQTQLSGELEQCGRLEVRQLLDPKSSDAHTLLFDLTFAGKDLKMDMPVPQACLGAQASSLHEGGQDARAPRWAWEETNPGLRMKGAYHQRLSDNKEEPSRQRLDIEQLSVTGRLGSFRLTLAGLDLFKLANLRGLPGQTWTDALRGFTMTGQVKPPAFDLLRALRMLPENHPISGTLGLEISFDREKDALELAKFAFQQTDPQREFFLLNLELCGALVHVRDLAARLLPTQPTPLAFSENCLRLLQEGGPATLLDHLGDKLSINKLQVESGPVARWLSKHYQEQQNPPVILAELIAKDWQPEGVWQAEGIEFTRMEPKVRKWSLVGAALRTDFAYFGPPSRPGGERPPLGSFTHDWNLKLGLAISPDNIIALDGDIDLETAFLNFPLPQLKYEYHKPAQEPCKLEIRDFLYAYGILAQAGKLKLTGKALPLEITDFRAEKGGYSGEVIIGGGPLPLAAIVNKYEPANDLLNLRVKAPQADLAYLVRLAGLPPALEAGGKLKEASLSYTGSLLAAEAMLAPNPAALLARFPKVDPADPRLLGLNPETDHLEFDAQLDEARCAYRPSADFGVNVQGGGQLRLTTRELRWKDLAVKVQLKAGGAEVFQQAFTAPVIRVASADAKLNLWRALKAPGLPVEVNAQLALSSPLNSATFSLAQAALLDALPKPEATGDKRLSALEKLALKGALNVSAFTTGGGTLRAERRSICPQGVETEPAVTAEAYGGQLALTDAEYDFSNARISAVEGLSTLAGVTHTQRFKATGLELALLLAGEKPDKRGYNFGARLDAFGDLKGIDFFSNDRLTWQGTVKFKLSNLAISSPPFHAVAANPAARWLARLDDEFSAAAAKALESGTISVPEFAQALPVAESQKCVNGLLLAAQTYLCRTFGVEAEQLEFETISPTVEIHNGSALLSSCQLTGKGSCAGLELLFKNAKVNLTDETFADDAGEGAVIYPLAIPRAAEERLGLEKWPPGAKAAFLQAMQQGQLPLRIGGRIRAPVVKYPWPELRGLGLRLLFDTEQIADAGALAKARKHLAQVWGGANLPAAADLAGRCGLNLPGWLERVPGLPPSLAQLRDMSLPQALERLASPEPETPGPGKSKR